MESFSVHARATGDKRLITVNEDATRRTYELAAAGQQDYLDLYARLATDFATRMPRNRTEHAAPPATIRHRPLLTAPVSPDILYGYGDPAVLWVEEERAWYMVSTSNDAPQSFPILRTANLADWKLVGFVFPEREKPAWTADGLNISDYWAPELHRVGDDYLVCFSAREPDRSLSIGIARARRPEGPYSTPPEPLLCEGVIDAHIFVESDGSPILFWKEDSNGVWPRLLAAMLGGYPSLIETLFDEPADRRTASLIAALWPWGRRQPAMEQFFMLQPLIEAVVDRYTEVRARLTALGTPDATAALTAMRTPIFAQRLSADGFALLGERTVVLVNDQPWEGHLIEGPWLTEQAGRFYLFYAGNDFSTDEYGIGVAVADSPWGPFRKMGQPLLRSDADWAGPGHPSVAPGPDGAPQLFYHAFFPGQAGYKAFRAMLTAKMRFTQDGVEVEAR